MPRARGPIGYIEHRSPRKEENGKYVIHPQFVQKDLYVNVTKYHARKVLDGYCEMPAGWLRATKEGPVILYRMRKSEE